MTLVALGAEGCLAAARQLVDEEPGAAAVRCAGITLTRADLHGRARSIAGHLAAAGAGPDRVVGVLTGRSIDLPVAQLATWYAGSGFLTLDPALPPARIAEMVDCAAPVAVVCAPQLRELLPESLPTVYTTAPAGPVVDPPAVIGAHLSYVIHTSGSTGRAKAVGVTNANLSAALRGWEQRYELREHRDRVLQVASLGFDVAVGDFTRTVLGGGCLVLPTRADLLDPMALDRLLRTEQISYLEITPSLLRAFCAGLDALRPVPSLRCLIVGGERFDAEDCRTAWQLLGPRGRLFNTYGLTECTIDTTVAELQRADTYPAGVPLGRPFPGTDLAVLDGELRPADSGQAYVGGDFVSRGYLGDPATTAQAFVPDPGGRAGERMFRSGDRVCRGSGGELVHLGRTDHQIKISGVRVDLAEIERVLTDLPVIGTSAAVVEGAGAGRHIVAHVVPTPGQHVDAVAIRAELRDVLPAVMVPADVVVHDRLPVTGNGKIDRTALRSAPDPAVPDLPPPPTRAGWIAALMSELLGAEVGPDDSFFGLGGSSLLATVLLGRLRSALHLALPDPGALWENPTPRALALACADAADGPRAIGAEIARLSPGQQRMWLTARLRPDDPSATVCVVLDLTGTVDESAVERAVTALTARHPALRTVVHIDADGAPVGQVLRAWTGRLVLLDGAGRPAEIATWCREPWDLEHGPLFRAMLLRRSGGGRLVLAGSHLVLDGESIRLLLAEFGALYRGEELPPAPRLTPSDIADWERSRAGSAERGAALAYWRERLAGAPAPLAAPRRGDAAPTCRHRTRIGAGVAAGLDAIARRQGSSLFTALLAGWLLVQRGWQGTRDVVVGIPFGDRRVPGAEDVVGFFVDTVALRVDVDPSLGTDALLLRVHDAVTQARRHREVPFDEVVHALGRSGRDTALFGSWFNFLGPADEAPELPGCTVRVADAPLLGGLFDVNAYITQDGPDLEIDLITGPAGPDDSHARELLDQFEQVLSGLAAGSTDVPAPVGVTPPHREHAELPAADALRSELSAGLRRRGSAAAVSDPGVTWSGDQVGAHVRRIVAELHAAGLGRRDLVAVVGERGAALVVALVAVIESGAAFCIQDTALPEAWQERQLAIARPAAVLTVRGGDSGRPAVELRRDLAGQPGTGDCDYLQFTTGTSAAPRAVRGGYPQLAAALAAYRELASLERRDRLALLAGLGHDPMLRDVLAPLAAGAEVVVPPPGYLRSPRELRTWLSVQRITVAHLTPSLLRALGAVDGAALTDLRLLVCAGDALRANDIAAAHRLAPHAELANGYGATETPQLPAFARVDPNAPPVRGTIAVRDGVAGSRLLVERSSGEDAAVGEVGEIVVESPALALGYGGDVDSSIAARFGPGACPQCRRYATADRGRRLADGSVEILGRGGDEVSIASHRVSLGAVDALLREEFALLDAITLVLDEDGAASRLASWLVPQTGTRLDAVTVRRRLRRIAPPEYLPSVVTVVGEIPRDPRGKPDRRALTDALPLPAAGHGGASPRLEAAHRIEDVVADAYREVLGVHPVPRDANFFDLGGNSLAMTRVLVRLEAELSRPLSTLTLFEFPSVAALAAALADPRTGMPATGAVTVIPVTDDADHRSAVRRAIRQGGLT